MFETIDTVSLVLFTGLVRQMALKSVRSVGQFSYLSVYFRHSQRRSNSLAGRRYHSKQLHNDVQHHNVNKDGPTAIVFMNMGGPVDQDEVPHFLRRLFV